MGIANQGRKCPAQNAFSVHSTTWHQMIMALSIFDFCVCAPLLINKCTSKHTAPTLRMINEHTPGDDIASAKCPPTPFSHLHDVSTVPFGVVDLKGDKILPLDAEALSVIDPHPLSLEAQLEELALRNGHFHLGGLAGHLCVDDVV